MKICPQCNQEKDYSHFYKKKQSKDGYDYWCKECWKAKRYKHVKAETTLSPEVRKIIYNMLDSIRNRRETRDREVTIKAADVYPLFEEFCANNYHDWSPRNPFKPSIDRIDNSKGYTPDNIRIVWYIENLCKNQFTDDDVIEFCKRKLGLL